MVLYIFVMEFFRLVDKETYDRERAERLMPAALMVGSICVLRDKTSDPSVSYAADLNVRVSKLGEPTDDGKRIIEVAILDPDLKEVKHDGVQCLVVQGWGKTE